MIPELERIGRILVEQGEGGCWHECENYVRMDSGGCECKKCGELFSPLESFHPNPDFSQWENFGRLLKIAEKKRLDFINSTYKDGGWCIEIYRNGTEVAKFDCSIDQISLLVAQELAGIIERGK